MATVTIQTSNAEKLRILEALHEVGDRQVTLRELGVMTEKSPTRVRYILLDLEEEGKIKRVPIVAFNKNYVRYKYVVTEGY